MNTNKQSKLMRLAAALAITAIEASAEERRLKGDRIVVSITDHKLVLLSGDHVLRVYEVAVGKTATPTPHGEFKIINHVKNPTWYGPQKTVLPGKDNPLGTRWMGLSAKGYGIHGTNVPTSIGKSASHGCIRMRQTDLEELFEMVDVGVTVELRGECPQLLAQIFADQGPEKAAAN
jgi:lipoprotein-anchoring transpeptidase ErfK/SrfK